MKKLILALVLFGLIEGFIIKAAVPITDFKPSADLADSKGSTGSDGSPSVAAPLATLPSPTGRGGPAGAGATLGQGNSESGGSQIAFNTQDAQIANDVAKLVYDVLVRFNLGSVGGGAFILYWLSKLVTNKTGLGSTWLGQFLISFVRAESMQIRIASPQQPAGEAERKFVAAAVNAATSGTLAPATKSQQ